MPKGIFIGIGGTGVTTVARLKAMLFQRAYNSDKAAMDADCTFIFYDTDAGAKNGALADPDLQRMMGTYPVIDQGTEYVDAGPTAPYNTYKDAKNSNLSDSKKQRMLEWAIDPDVQGHFQLPQKQLSEGAGAQRMAGRTGIYRCKEAMEGRILTGLQGMQKLAKQGANLNVEHPAIWVFSSSNGGTSSSALLDVLYMADRLYKANVANADPYLRLVLYMPKEFIDVNKENALTYGRNAYATLWELNEFRIDAFLRNDGNKFGSFAVHPDKTDWKDRAPWSVCSYVMAVDTESQSGKVSLDQMYNNTAEMCYFLHTGAAGQKMVSNLDNDLSVNGPYAHDMRTATDDPFQWAKFIVGTGYKAITKADDFLKNYVRYRMHYDLYGYGLLGFDIEKILPEKENRITAAKQFATEYILKHLANIDKMDASPKGSLYTTYKTEFEKLAIPSADEVPSKEEWSSMGTTFTTNCKELMRTIQNKFDDPSQNGSKAWYMTQIEHSVMEGVDKNIVDFGLRYTYSLLTIVDDDYCEAAVMGKLKQKNNLCDLENEINDIIENNRPKKGIANLVVKMEEYRKACTKELAIEHIRSIVADITKEKVGLLEYMRKGNQSHKGINGVIETINAVFGTYKKQYQELASSFSKTANEVCSDYFPRVHTFVETGDVWVRNNEFETLYASILPLDTTDGSPAFESTNYGCPPIRKTEDKGLAPMLSEIKIKVPSHSLLFAEMAMSNPQTTFNNIYADFSKYLNKHIEDCLSGNNLVKIWLDKPLETVFDESFMTDGALDTNKRTQYISNFTASIPVFYPCSTGSIPQVTHRWLYVGASSDFAKTLGLQDGNSSQQYVPDDHIGNRFLVCKIEVGHNFYDYKYFSTIKNFYETERRVIENLGSGCHIHQAFVHRDIVSSFEQLKAKKFTDFISLCWYDSFFEYLNEIPDKTYIKTFFGDSMGSMPLPGMLGQPQGMPMPNMPGQLQGMSMPGIPGQPQDMPMPGMSEQPQGMPMLGMLGQPQGMPMPGMPGQLQGMPMPGMSQNMPMPGTMNIGQNMNIENGYKPIICIEEFGKTSINFNKITITNNHIGFERNTSKKLEFTATSLTDIWRSIVNYEDSSYSEDYFSLISQTYDQQSPNIKDDIKKQFYSASQFNNGSSEVWNRFIKKIEILTKKYQNLQTDQNVWYQIVGTINNLIYKNIFY